jgi:hypothetical protein
MTSLGRPRIRREEAIFFCPRSAQSAEKQRRYEKNRSSVFFRHCKDVSGAQMSAILGAEILEPARRQPRVTRGPLSQRRQPYRKGKTNGPRRKTGRGGGGDGGNAASLGGEIFSGAAACGSSGCWPGLFRDLTFRRCAVGQIRFERDPATSAVHPAPDISLHCANYREWDGPAALPPPMALRVRGGLPG